jgi:glycosyltransferase involved in cell wall biosynthesis
MDDPQRRSRMGQLGRQRVEADLNWDRQAGQLIRAYDALAPRSVA